MHTLTKTIVALAALVAAEGCIFSNDTTNEQTVQNDVTISVEAPSADDPPVPDNSLLAMLDVAIEDNGGRSTARMYQDILEEAYGRMDRALMQGDILGFMDHYRTTFDYHNRLISERAEDGLLWGSGTMVLFREMTTGIYGSVFTRASFADLDAWPESCGPGNDRASFLLGEISDVVIRERSGDGSRILDRWRWDTVYDQETLDAMRATDVHPEAGASQNGRFGPDGDFSRLAYNRRGDIAVFQEFEKRRDGIESSVTRSADVIDFGMNGVDDCDAILAGIPFAEKGAANERYAGALERTDAVLEVRYR